MTAAPVPEGWEQDGVDSGWYSKAGVGSVRSSKSYGRPGGWWFLPRWLPDKEAHDVGPLPTRREAFETAERLAREAVEAPAPATA